MRRLVLRPGQGVLSVVVGVTIFLLIFPRFSSSYGVVILTEVFIYAIFAMSLNLLLGYAGLPSLGHAAFFGVGGYTVGILTTKAGINSFWLILVAALLASAAVALVFGVFSIRTSGTFFLMLTFAFAQVVWAIAWSWRSLTGGDDGLPGIPRPSLGIPLSMWSETNFYYMTLVICVIAAFLLYRICQSPFGQVVQGIRENETRMQVLGYNTWKYKYVCFVLAGVFGGLAGALKAYQDAYTNPSYASVITSGLALLMCIIGGSRVFWGPALGAAAIWVLRSTVIRYTEYWSLVLGVVFIIVIMFASQGIGGYLVQLKQVVRRARTED